MQIHRKLASRRTLDRYGSCVAARLNYVVSNCGNRDKISEAADLVRHTAPDAIGSARKKYIELINTGGNGTYEFEVSYAVPEPYTGNSGNERVWSFEVTTAKYRINEAKELVRIRKADPDVVPPDPGTLIGWDGRISGESEIAGAVVLIPEMYERCVATYRASAINAAFRRKLLQLAGRTNAAPFHGWNTGEVLLTRADQGKPYLNEREVELIDITYTFAIRPAGETSCAGIRIADAAPWNILWHIAKRDPAGNTTKVSGVYESRVYDSGNFSALHL